MFSEIKGAFDTVFKHLDFVENNVNNEEYPAPPCDDSIYCRLLSIAELEIAKKSDEQTTKKCDRETLPLLKDMINSVDTQSKAQIDADLKQETVSVF